MIAFTTVKISRQVDTKATRTLKPSMAPPGGAAGHMEVKKSGLLERWC